MEIRALRFPAPFGDGSQLHALHRGDARAPLAVLLHGGGAHARWWDVLAPRLAEAFHVVALDFRGHGESDASQDLEPGAFDRDLDALLDHLGEPSPILVGHSLGARVALERAVRHTPRALVLVDIAHGAVPTRRGVIQRAFGVRRSYRTRDEALARFQLVPPAPRVAEPIRLAIAEHTVRELADGRFGFQLDARWLALPTAALPDLSRVTCPALLLRGADSPLLTREGAAELVSLLPAARLVEIPDAGHHVHLERPAETLHALRSFLVEAR